MNRTNLRWGQEARNLVSHDVEIIERTAATSLDLDIEALYGIVKFVKVAAGFHIQSEANMTAKKRHSLHWIAMEFAENGWHGEEGLLDALRNKELTASLQYPTGWLSYYKIPSDIWRNLDREDFIAVPRSIHGRSNIDECDFALKGELFFDYEFNKLRTIAQAAATRAVSEIDDSLIRETCERLGLQSLEGFEDWPLLINLFVEMEDELRDDNNDDFDIFVLDEEWRRFSRQKDLQSKDQSPPMKSGAPEKEIWRMVLEETIRQVCTATGKDLRELTNSKTWAEFVKKLYDSGILDGAKDPAKDDTIYRKLKDISKRPR